MQKKVKEGNFTKLSCPIIGMFLGKPPPNVKKRFFFVNLLNHRVTKSTLCNLWTINSNKHKRYTQIPFFLYQGPFMNCTIRLFLHPQTKFVHARGLYSVTQSYAYSFWGDVVLDTFNNVSREEYNIWDQIYKEQICPDFYYDDFWFT